VSLQALVALEAYFRSIVEGIECRIEHIILYIQSVLYSVLRASGVSIFEREKNTSSYGIKIKTSRERQ
jgi:hypothetical protein